MAERNDIGFKGDQCHDSGRESMEYIKKDRDDPSWAAHERQLFIPALLNIRYAIDEDVDGYFCPGSEGRT